MTHIIVSGPPGSGKSSLAEPLSQRLGMAMISKDTIKEALGDSLDVGGADWTSRLSNASFAVLWALAAQTPAAVLEGNFLPSAGAKAKALGGRLLEVYCQCPLEVCRERFADRLARGGRHPVHPPTVPDVSFFEQFAQPISVGPVLEVPTLRPVDMDAVVRWVQDHGWDGENGPPTANAS